MHVTRSATRSVCLAPRGVDPPLDAFARILFPRPGCPDRGIVFPRRQCGHGPGRVLAADREARRHTPSPHPL
jgi:hypothetical protein